MGAGAVVQQVDDNGPGDAIAQRLRDLGFVSGEPVRLVARGPLGAEPLLVQIGYTRFALRRAEAARVRVVPETSVVGAFLAPVASQSSASSESESSRASGTDASHPHTSDIDP
jgi:ferrous iron transport protein A